MLKKLLPLLIASYVVPSQAALVFTVDSMTTNEATFSINGAFDETSIGFIPGYLAIKNDWSNNIGTNTNFIADYASLKIEANTLEIGGVQVADTSVTVGNTGSSYMDSIYISNPNGGASTSFSAGTTVFGSITFSSISNAFDPSQVGSLELLSGYKQWFGIDPENPYSGPVDWARLESTVQVAPVPLPASVWLLGAGLLTLLKAKRIRKDAAAAA